MPYLEFLNRLNGYAEEDFAQFQKKLIFTQYTVLGVRTPVLRSLAKSLNATIDELLSYPNEYYEVVFIKIAVIASLPFEEFLSHLEYALSLIDNWALCDCFKANCIKKRKREFLSVLEKCFASGKEYYIRYTLVTLLNYYVEEAYLPTVVAYLCRTNANAYYIHMAAAWLTAELLVKHYEEGLSILREGLLSPKTHNKAIQKAIESYRVSNERKEFLRSLKIK